jgi:hypothetical protein
MAYRQRQQPSHVVAISEPIPTRIIDGIEYEVVFS